MPTAGILLRLLLLGAAAVSADHPHHHDFHSHPQHRAAEVPREPRPPHPQEAARQHRHVDPRTAAAAAAAAAEQAAAAAAARAAAEQRPQQQDPRSAAPEQRPPPPGFEDDDGDEVAAALKAAADAEEEAGGDEPELKDEPCNFNLFYACAAHQLWAFHKTFRAFMGNGTAADPSQIRPLQTEYCKMMDWNAQCADQLSEVGCSPHEVQWFKERTVLFTLESLGEGQAEWKGCPWGQ